MYYYLNNCREATPSFDICHLSFLFLMFGVLPVPPAILVTLQPFLGVLFILRSRIIFPLTNGTN